MEQTEATSDVPSKDPHLPPMFRVGDVLAPKAPQAIAGARLEDGALVDLVVKLAYTVARFTTDYVVKRLHLSVPLAGEVLEQACREGLVEETMMSSQGRNYYRITQR